MIGSAERALAELRGGLAAPYRVSPAKPSVRVAEPRKTTSVPHTLRWLGVFAAGMCAAGLSAIFFWPTGNGSASIGVQAPIVEQATAEPLLDDPSTLQRPSVTDAVSRMYAAEFGRTDMANLRCLAEAVYFEARGEPYIGQVAVAQVVLNRARSGKWPRGLCAVIAQGVERGEKCQFSYMCRTTRAAPVGPMWDRAQEVAIDAARGRVWLRELVEATHYHTTAVAPVWRQGLDMLGTFGTHIFYRTPELGYVLAVARASEPAVQASVPAPSAEKTAAVPTGAENPAEERSFEATSAHVTSTREFKLPEAPPQTAPVAAPKPRPLVRQAVSSAAPTAAPSKSNDDWVKDMHNR
jgi:hypothetical protein